MNQTFGFKPQFKQLILDGIKTCTTRIETPFRLKCDIGDIIHCCTGVRTKHYHHFADAKIIDRFCWKTVFPIACPILKEKEDFSYYHISWNDFAVMEGFNCYEELTNWFCKNLITYKFKVIKVFLL